MPKFVEKINGKSIYTDDIEVDLKVVKILREI